MDSGTVDSGSFTVIEILKKLKIRQKCLRIDNRIEKNAERSPREADDGVLKQESHSHHQMEMSQGAL